MKGFSLALQGKNFPSFKQEDELIAGNTINVNPFSTPHRLNISFHLNLSFHLLSMVKLNFELPTGELVKLQVLTLINTMHTHIKLKN